VRLRSGYEDRPARLEIVPLMDAIFLLLVFFVYAMMSMIVHRGVKVQLPTGTTAQVDKRDYVAVAITGDNRIFVNRRPVAMNQLVPAVREAQAGSRDRAVYISGDERSGFGTAFSVLDKLRSAGITQVNFECKVEPKASPRP
jgi:biopolymer transport protein ExbD